MTTESETFDSKSVANAPPSTPFVVFSFLSSKRECNTVLPHIRDLVSAPGDTSSSVASTANACATALAAAQFFDLLQTLNIKIGQL
ncbi:uncharacterized protein EDB91DRAFT_1247157 [Suillus paluster]|uniref:uncharacterized protein n=1 Tax=Suillus paluster TaxID=48578 RepID=UPI001B867BF6|nr:uncharacterized protein EDB91DRAFT_1247157 [Suillus paluster]KAG1743665.1 hypothetical protein EDB91DRAFT_1247157 [Suillus paluster]